LTLKKNPGMKAFGLLLTFHTARLRADCAVPAMANTLVLPPRNR